MEQQLGEDRIKKSLGASVRDGVLFSIMTGLGDAYMPALLLFWGATDAAVGLLTSLSYALAALAQLFISRGMETWKNRKKFVVGGVVFHAFFWLAQIALIFSPLDNALKIPLSIGIFALYFGLNAFIAPAWSGWMADLVPENMRGGYFGHRNEMTGLALFLATLAGGYIMGWFGSEVLLGFAALFLIAFACRIGSAYYLSRMAEPSGGAGEFRKVGWRALLLGEGWGNSRLFILGIALILFTRYVAAPFYNVFMLRNLGFTYAEFGIITAMSLFAKIFSYPYWGKLADRFGNRAVLVSTGVLVCILPLPWVFASNFNILFFTQLISGFAWAGFELVSFNHILVLAPRDYRVSLVSRYNFFTNIAIVLGATFGAFLLSGVLPEVWMGLVALQLLFLISSILRMLVALLILPRVHEQRAAYPYSDMGFFLDASIVYPAQSMARQVARGIKFASGVKAPLRGAKRAALDAFEKGRKKMRGR
ncbi:MAG: MFS transporter [Candidatus Burarchaeum sp.]|nr:MFS transporter [Candidatus Burarchaeum sp.]MDO8339288.1 MFS transporter [Candidatus Burarchaeum sp.]